MMKWLTIIFLGIFVQINFSQTSYIFGQVTDLMANQPVDNAIVKIHLKNDSVLTVFTDANGRYDTTINYTSYFVGKITAEKSGYVMTGGYIVFQNPVELNFNVDMMPEVNPIGKGEINGTVKEYEYPNATKLLPNVSVILSLRLGGVDNNLRPLDTALTDQNGSFSFPGLDAPAGYTLTAISNGYGVDSKNVGLDTNETEVVGLEIRKIIDSGVIAVIVKDDNGTNLNNAIVIAYQVIPLSATSSTLNKIDSGTTNASGNINFPVLGSSGYVIRVNAPGFNQVSESIDIWRGTDTVNVSLTPVNPGLIIGVIKDVNTGLVKPNINVKLIKGTVIPYTYSGGGGINWENLNQTSSNVTGDYSFQNLQPSGNGDIVYKIIVGGDTSGIIEVLPGQSSIYNANIGSGVLNIGPSVNDMALSYQILENMIVFSLPINDKALITLYSMSGTKLLQKYVFPTNKYLSLLNMDDNGVIIMTIQVRQFLESHKLSIK